MPQACVPGVPVMPHGHLGHWSQMAAAPLTLAWARHTLTCSIPASWTHGRGLGLPSIFRPQRILSQASRNQEESEQVPVNRVCSMLFKKPHRNGPPAPRDASGCGPPPRAFGCHEEAEVLLPPSPWVVIRLWVVPSCSEERIREPAADFHPQACE